MAMNSQADSVPCEFSGEASRDSIVIVEVLNKS